MSQTACKSLDVLQLEAAEKRQRILEQIQTIQARLRSSQRGGASLSVLSPPQVQEYMDKFLLAALVCERAVSSGLPYLPPHIAHVIASYL